MITDKYDISSIAASVHSIMSTISLDAYLSKIAKETIIANNDLFVFKRCFI